MKMGDVSTLKWLPRPIRRPMKAWQPRDGCGCCWTRAAGSTCCGLQSPNIFKKVFIHVVSKSNLSKVLKTQWIYRKCLKKSSSFFFHRFLCSLILPCSLWFPSFSNLPAAVLSCSACCSAVSRASEAPESPRSIRAAPRQRLFQRPDWLEVVPLKPLKKRAVDFWRFLDPNIHKNIDGLTFKKMWFSICRSICVMLLTSEWPRLFHSTGFWGAKNKASRQHSAAYSS